MMVEFPELLTPRDRENAVKAVACAKDLMVGIRAMRQIMRTQAEADAMERRLIETMRTLAEDGETTGRLNIANLMLLNEIAADIRDHLIAAGAGEIAAQAGWTGAGAPVVH